MRIFVDADACPVKNIIVEVAKEYKLKVFMVFDTSHKINDGYSENIIVDKDFDSADFEILNRIEKNDVVITQDYGLASLVLGKKANAINQNGFLYTENNIDKLLFERHLGQKIRNAGGKFKNVKKRNEKDNLKFENIFRKFIEEKINE